MSIRVLSCAEAELNEAVRYYNEQCAGLGFEFAAEVKAAIGRIAAFPDVWPRFSPRSRRCLVDRFPYGILYHQCADGILVLAIMHLNREPGLWGERLRQTIGDKAAAPASRKRRR
jgi:hypothetical protein